eukprot:CAMPEP_0185699650 /NCGR_PEP_ID=MMETSP1164-20130828/7046_1 /TAXON_ID=1104430 /ORGANISM="Chrysoreinhardia sp, Strain CCMP2950" /LENGTH=559 /DNA_ID=CAMNT_0028366591 /DNA_START=170 /DNA_END=1849 /DNA_ORIENTATION=+
MRVCAQQQQTGPPDDTTAPPPMVVLGVTGGIAMGKSSVVRHLREAFGAAVHDADAAVHRLYGPGGAAVAPVAAAFGDAVLSKDDDVVSPQDDDDTTRSCIDRASLARALQAAGDRAAAFAKLEAIVHPLVSRDRDDFLAEARRNGEWLAVVDIPLLYETIPDVRAAGIDYVATVTCGAAEQRRRALCRPGMTAEKLDAIMGRQLEDADRQARSDFVVDTSHDDLAASKAQVAAIVETLYERHVRADGRGGVAQSAAAAAASHGVVRVVSLDLDDTVWPAGPPLLRARQKSEELLPQLMPRTAEALDGADPYKGFFGPGAAAGSSSEQLLAHDITARRRQRLRSLAAQHGDSLEAADQVLEGIVEERSRATEDHVLDAALDLVEALKARHHNGSTTTRSRIRVGALTNGNAARGGRLGAAVDFWITAADVGAQKPRLAAFLAVAAQAGLDASGLRHVVHVGDSVTDDVLGALEAGARAVLVPRPRVAPDTAAAADTASWVSTPVPSVDTSLLADVDPDRWAAVASLSEIPAVIDRWEQAGARATPREDDDDGEAVDAAAA